MPIIGSPITPVTIATLTNEVIAKTENRESDRLRVETWVRDALIEIAANPGYRNEFDELEVTGPLYTLTTGQQEYNGDLFINTDDVNLAFLDFFIWLDPPTNSNRRQLIQKHYQHIDRWRPAQSNPIDWYRFENMIGFNPMPKTTFQVQARYYRLHPIDDSCLNATVILLPRDWHEIIVWAAAERGYMELLEYEKAATIHALLFGDPTKPTRPGMIAGRLKRREREDWRRDRSLAPVKRPYTYR